MDKTFRAAVSALCQSVLRERCPDASCGEDEADRMVRFVLDQQGRMPDHLRLPLRTLTLLFDLWPIVFYGRPFHRLSHERRWRQIETWKRSRLGFRNDLIRFYESLTIFFYHSVSHDSNASA